MVGAPHSRPDNALAQTLTLEREVKVMAAAAANRSCYSAHVSLSAGCLLANERSPVWRPRIRRPVQWISVVGAGFHGGGDAH